MNLRFLYTSPELIYVNRNRTFITRFGLKVVKLSLRKNKERYHGRNSVSQRGVVTHLFLSNAWELVGKLRCKIQ